MDFVSGRGSTAIKEYPTTMIVLSARAGLSLCWSERMVGHVGAAFDSEDFPPDHDGVVFLRLMKKPNSGVARGTDEFR